jgi:cytosine/uracil/thiamine/allantoin permease
MTIVLIIAYLFIGFLVGYGHKYYLEARKPDEIEYWEDFETIAVFVWPIAILMWLIGKLGVVAVAAFDYIWDLNYSILTKPLTVPLKWVIFEIFAPRKNVRSLRKGSVDEQTP